jgi:hypothetical protein
LLENNARWNPTMFLRIKKIIGGGAALIFVAAWFAYGNLQNSYIIYPQTPNLLEGKTEPHAVKGMVVYITKEQERFLSWLNWISIASAAVVVLVALIHMGDPFKSKK